MQESVVRHRSRPQREGARRLFIGLLLVVVLLVGSGCDTRGGTSAPPSDAPIVAAYVPPITAVYCPDDTSSYPHADFTAANRFVADALDAAVRPNRAPLILYVTLINSHTYDPASSPLVVQIPAIPADPSPPTLAPLPTPSLGNPYASGKLKAQIQAANKTKEQEYQQALGQAHAHLTQVRTQVRSQTDQLRRLSPPVDERSTSVLGCLARASERFSGVRGQKLLILSTDLDNNSAVDATSYNLTGSDVLVTYFYCTTAPVCRARSASWRRLIQQAGARSIHIYEPATTRTLPPLFNGAELTGGAA